MNKYWSTFVQKSEELYASRALRFHDGNKDLWLNALQIKNGMKILEVGCGGGIFCHRIKKYLPDTDVTGLDFDIGHIDYAKSKSIEMNLDCKFVSGDATALPFEDNSFDICFSHTVMSFCEPNLFTKEQYRVLKPSGKMIVLCGINFENKPESWMPTDECEEKELFDKIWSAADKNEMSKIKRYEDNESHYFRYLEKYNFKNVSADAFAVVAYAPDSANVNDEMAITQINECRLTELCSVEKAHIMAPEALTEDEYNELIEMINRRFDKRAERYAQRDKVWDYRVSTILVITGTK